MTQVLLLLIIALWMLPSAHTVGPWLGSAGLLVFIAGYLLMVAAFVYWGRRLALQFGGPREYRMQRRFSAGVRWGRIAIVAWMAVGIYAGAEWKTHVARLVAPISLYAASPGDASPTLLLAVPGLMVGTLPSLLAWIGLWWAQYPLDRHMRERQLAGRMDAGLPVHAPPALGRYLLGNVRQQIMFLLLPVLMALALHDLISLGLWVAGLSAGAVASIEGWVLLPAGAIVFAIAPLIMTRALNASQLGDGPLRQRLHGICQRAGLRYRDILLWRTDYSMGNAAVLGIVPRWRYILLTDLLIENLSDEQIEAVFAHEVGHIVHHHAGWFVALFALSLLVSAGPGATLARWLDPQSIHQVEEIIAIASITLTFVALGYLSRRFERQADVYAARMLQTDWNTHTGDLAGRPAARRTSLRMDALEPAVAHGGSELACSGGGGFEAVSLEMGCSHSPDSESRGLKGVEHFTGMALETSTSDVRISQPVLERSKPAHDRALSLAIGSSYVGEYGAAVMASALDRAAEMNQMPKRAWDWRHPTIAERKRFLLHLSADPANTRIFDQRMIRLSLWIAACAVVLIGWTVWESMR